MQHGLHWKLRLIHNSLSSRNRDALLYAKCSLGDGGTSISMPTRKRNRSKFRNAFFEKNMSSACNEMRRWKCFVALVKCENNQTLESICLRFSRTKNNVCHCANFISKNILDVFTSAVSGPTRCPCTWHDPKFVSSRFPPTDISEIGKHMLQPIRSEYAIWWGKVRSNQYPVVAFHTSYSQNFEQFFFPPSASFDFGLVHAQLAVQHQKKPPGSPLRRKNAACDSQMRPLRHQGDDISGDHRWSILTICDRLTGPRLWFDHLFSKSKKMGVEFQLWESKFWSRTQHFPRHSGKRQTHFISEP